MRIVVTKRDTIIGTEYTASYGLMSSVSTAGRQYAIEDLVMDMEWVCRNWIVGKDVEVIDQEVNHE